MEITLTIWAVSFVSLKWPGDSHGLLRCLFAFPPKVYRILDSLEAFPIRREHRSRQWHVLWRRWGVLRNPLIELQHPKVLPKRVYFRSSCGWAAYVKKNWLEFVFGPLLAIATIPRSVCLRLSLNSSSNLRPQIELPPLPLPVGSPVCTMNPFMLRWNKLPL